MAINFAYPIGLKREIVTALEPLFHDDFPIPELRNHVYVGLEYPFERTNFPAIYITYNEDQLRSAGVGHTEIGVADDGTTPIEVKHWFFTGSVNFNIMALSPSERDKLGAALINILAFGDTDGFLEKFKDQLMNSTYIDLQYLQELIHPGGEVNGQTPWASETEMVFGRSYSIDVLGEFYSDKKTGALVQWEHVQIHPYLPGGSRWW